VELFPAILPFSSLGVIVIMTSPYPSLGTLPSRPLSRLSGSQSLHSGLSQLPKRSQSLRSLVPLSPKPKKPATRRKLEVACRNEMLYFDEFGGLQRREEVEQVWPTTCKRKKTGRPEERDWNSLVVSRRPASLLGGFVTEVAQTGPASHSFFCSLGKSQALPTIQVDKGLLIVTFLRAGKAGVQVRVREQEHTARQNDVLLFRLHEEFQLRNLSAICTAQLQIIECMI